MVVRQPRQPHAAAGRQQRPRAARRAGHLRGALPALLRSDAVGNPAEQTDDRRSRSPSEKPPGRDRVDPARAACASTYSRAGLIEPCRDFLDRVWSGCCRTCCSLLRRGLPGRQPARWLRSLPLLAAPTRRAADLAGAVQPPYYGLILSLGVVLGLLLIRQSVCFMHPRSRAAALRRGDDVPLLRLRRAADARGSRAASTPTASGPKRVHARTTRSAGSPGRKASRSRCCWSRDSSRWPGRWLVPSRLLGEVRRLLRDKIGGTRHPVRGGRLDLGGHDEREDV